MVAREQVALFGPAASVIIIKCLRAPGHGRRLVELVMPARQPNAIKSLECPILPEAGAERAARRGDRKWWLNIQPSHLPSVSGTKQTATAIVSADTERDLQGRANVHLELTDRPAQGRRRADVAK